MSLHSDGISSVTRDELARALKKFRRTCDELGVKKINAVGTSALRDSKNGRQIITHLKNKTGIKVHLINGHREALLLHRAVSEICDLRKQHLNARWIWAAAVSRSCSAEEAESASKKVCRSEPFACSQKSASKAATKISQPEFERPFTCFRAHMFDARVQPVDLLVGTGGNLRSLGKLAWRLGLSRSRNRFTRHGLEVLTIKLFRLNLETRMKRFQMRKDRADVILPAAVVTLELMRIFDLKQIVVPNVGIKNGLFWESLDP